MVGINFGRNRRLFRSPPKFGCKQEDLNDFLWRRLFRETDSREIISKSLCRVDIPFGMAGIDFSINYYSFLFSLSKMTP
jgi:hypothetical protein